MSNPSSGPGAPARAPRALRLAVAGSVILMIAAGGLFYYASQVAATKRAANAGAETVVNIHAHNCEPNALTVPAGKNAFRIVNRSERAVEWEILDGVLVVEERENIAPGLSQVINANLMPGDYVITCGLLSNPRGTLHVTPTAESDAKAKARPSMTAFIGPLSEYRVYLSLQGSALIRSTTALQQAIEAGDLAAAQAAYLPARTAYQRIAPAAQRLAELDNAINARADYFEKREADAGFTGFHRIEYALYGQNDLKGLAPVADQLVADIGVLQSRLRGLDMPPERLAGSASKLLRRVADNLPAGGEDHYGHAELVNLQGTYEGTKKISELLQPLLVKAAPALQKRVDERFAAFDAALAPYREGEGFKPAPLDEAQRKSLAEPVRALAEELGKVNAALGLE